MTPMPVPGFFERNREERTEIIDGLLREGQLAAFAGAFGMGKTPVLADLTVRLCHGIDWCGRTVIKRPVIVFDCETAGPDYKKAISAVALRLGLRVPRVPEEVEVYLERDDLSELGTKQLLDAVSRSGHEPKLNLVAEALARKPNAVVLIDPLEMFFQLDTTRKSNVLALYRYLRTLLAKFPEATLVNTFNLRKKDRQAGRPDLLSSPRDWLEEVCGSLDILNRSDVRLGIDQHKDEVRVLNGIVRGREMHPILLRPVLNVRDELAGFEQIAADQMDLFLALSPSQKSYWDKLPQEFKFEAVADTLVPRSTLSRIAKATCSLGALIKGADGTFRKAH
jgi:hypothetical protein